MEKLIFYSNTKLKRQFELKKMGIIIRNLTKEENEIIIKKYKGFVLPKKYKELANKYYNIRKNLPNYSKNEREDVYCQMISLEEKNKKMYDIMWDLYLSTVNNPFERMNTRYIRKYIEKLIIVEIDLIEFCKHFEERHIHLLLPKLLNFSNYVATYDGDIKEFEGMLFKFEIFSNEEKDFINSLGILLNENEKNNEFNNENLEKLENMLNVNDANFNFNFMMLIDDMFNANNLIENRLVNKVAHLERLLISKDSNKQENFVLKMGMLCNRLLDIPNDILSAQLKEIYNIRSLIVHGNSDKIINSIDKYKQVFSNLIEKGNKQQTKNNILLVVDSILEFYFIEVLKKYLEKPQLCEYIRKN